ncbi:MAG: N-acetylmuramoyl-L-alanine amidase, partial [Deltaproteobacteria bacterium]|nr:N-acetylmuramoyl-L-alanine amidase [Deltaproteobacteria bacterium]
KILFDLMHNAKVNESRRLAGLVQNALVGEMEKKYTRIRDKGVKQAPFYVLLGAQMPAILVETSFISNPRECRRLMDPVYQERLCDAIIDGIEQYIRETHPVARRDETAAERVGCS